MGRLDFGGKRMAKNCIASVCIAFVVHLLQAEAGATSCLASSSVQLYYYNVCCCGVLAALLSIDLNRRLFAAFCPW